MHRDLGTGDALTGQETVDAIEILWHCMDGDISGLTQEQVTVNCSATSSIEFNAGGYPDDDDGSLLCRVSATPTDDDFAAFRIVWTGQTYDAFSHVSHIAAGSIAPQCSARAGNPRFIEPDEAHAGVAQWWGLAIRDGADLFFIAGTMDPDLSANQAVCWRSKSAFQVYKLDAGHLRIATTAEKRTASLVVDPIASQNTNEVGFFYGIAHRESVSYTRESSYTSTYQIDNIQFPVTYSLGCVPAFVNKSTVVASCNTGAATPSGDVVADNIEPVEMRGFSATLTLATLPAWDVAIHSRALKEHHDAGYSYHGTGTTSNGVNVELWYTPCLRLTMFFDDGGACPAWVHILHSGTNYSADACEDADDPYFGDFGNGKATAPSFAGVSLRDYYRPCVSAFFNPLLAAAWFGSDCAGDINAGTVRNKDGIRGECQDLFPGEIEPVCVQGDLPNQLTWLTNCYSLDPIAIGYRRRVKDGYGFGSTGTCGSPSGTAYCDAAPDGSSRASVYCGISHLRSMGFTFGVDGILGGSTHTSGHFYVDITE